MTNRDFKAVLFWVLIAIFVASAALTLMGLIGYGNISPTFLKAMFGALIAETATTIFAFWKKISGDSFEEPPDVGGTWEYECIREDESYKHGGKCEIFVKKAQFGWEFSIRGERDWMAFKIDGEWKVEELNAAAAWKNTWGTFTGDDSLQYGYSVNIRGKIIEGYGSATIARDAGRRPKSMRGNFYQLPPHDPFYGFQKYWRPETNK
jgi:hypothetical protein